MGQVIETDEQGQLVITAELLGGVQPHSRYRVETLGAKLVVELEPTAEQRRQDYEVWLKEWDALTEEITAAWNTDMSAVEIVAEMRR